VALSRDDAYRFVWLIGLVSLFSDMTCSGLPRRFWMLVGGVGCLAA